MKMKSIFSRILLIAFIALVALSLSAFTVQANAVDTPVATWDQVLAFLVSLGILVPVVAGSPPLVSMIVDFAKRLKMPSKYAPLLSSAINLLIYALAWFAGPERQAQFASALGALYAVLPYVLTFFASLVATVKWHNLLTVAGVGYRVTPRKV